MEQTFTLAALAAAALGLNDTPAALALTDVSFGPECITATLQEGLEGALVLHLLPDGGHDVTVAGAPSQRARHAMRDVCSGLARAWRGEPAHTKLSVGALRAAIECTCLA